MKGTPTIHTRGFICSPAPVPICRHDPNRNRRSSPNGEFGQPDSGPVGGLSPTVGRHYATPKEPQGSNFGGLPSMGQAAVTSVQSLHHHRVVVEGGRVAGSN
jgi:hypothetical protein